ncbi:Phosphoribosyl pyrophosphate synthase [Sulfidibacter corallicola]|uniref:ribose-phosphate diphosphokinase n=1 Tax=Sulfidibacter corallicola TaxID=2818388 RepID=A0A8A4TPI0_SULCO|nr:ribose-phosphate diphosphokinase [Sulfidibacter corallicola]QTD50982.1 ribose-phosphate pyrophosphokinase [Sulfidibacter corallicola]
MARSATPALVYSTPQYRYFSEKLAQRPNFALGGLERVRFPDGEIYQRLTHPVRDRDAVVVGGTVSSEETMELYDLASGLANHGVDHLTLVVPYFGYATMERKSRSGEIVTAKNRAVLLSSIPRARICNEIVMIDLHTGGIPHYFENHLRPYHLISYKLIAKIVNGLDKSSDLILASTDAGRAKWVAFLANQLGLPAAFVYKRRISGTETEIRGINADVAGKHVVIYDDMIRTGGSLVKAGQAYRDGGAVRITAISTHGLFAGEGLARVRDSGLFDRVIVTDTHPNAIHMAESQKDGFLRVESVIPEVASFLENRENWGDAPEIDVS